MKEKELDLIIKYYECARNETIQRIRLRDYILLIYLGATTATYGVALKNSLVAEVLLIVPFLALGAAIIISQHNSTIGSLARYCAKELGGKLSEILPDSNIPQWDNSNVLKGRSSYYVSLRAWGSVVILVVPCIPALVLNLKHAYLSNVIPFGVSWYLALLCTLLIIFLKRKCYKERQKNHCEIWGSDYY
ncbi:hypothetical protein [Vibrio harveyi]